MSTKKWKFVIVSKDTEFRISREKFDEAASLADAVVTAVQIANNRKPLAEVYNEHLDQERCSNDPVDYLVFMHADASFNLEGFMNHISMVSEKYDIIGLCGTATMNVMQSPLNWFTSSIPSPSRRWGCVVHGELGNQMSWFSQHSPEVGDHEVACIDGVCIVLAKKAILDRSLRFDPTVGEFDFYDTDISMQAMMSGLKLGVVVRKDLMHFSVGKSILSPHFLENELKFRKKWSLPIPPRLARFEAERHQQLNSLDAVGASQASQPAPSLS